MSHRFYTGTIYHKRILPKKHQFKYNFFMIDIELSTIEKLKNTLFSQNRFNLFSFNTKDHFGKNKNFNENINSLLKSFGIENNGYKIRFITLPRILGFVFNPISLLVLFKDNIPIYLLAEVHNYHGGRIVYSSKLEKKDNDIYEGFANKDMYVSPFFKRKGEYKFSISYSNEHFVLNIILIEDDKKVLTTTLNTKAKIFNKKTILNLFFRHSFLTFFVVTRTIYQAFRLKLKGLKWSQPIKQDQQRRY